MILMQEKIITCNHLSELKIISKEIIELLKENKVVAFYGDMGAGKTTLIKAICEQLGVKEIVSSPTFAIMNEYHDQNNESIFHFDFYRIKSESEVFDIGYENYFYSNNFCFIEWPEKIKSLLNFNHANVYITVDNKKRVLKIIP